MSDRSTRLHIGQPKRERPFTDRVPLNGIYGLLRSSPLLPRQLNPEPVNHDMAVVNELYAHHLMRPALVI